MVITSQTPVWSIRSSKIYKISFPYQGNRLINVNLLGCRIVARAGNRYIPNKIPQVVCMYGYVFIHLSIWLIGSVYVCILLSLCVSIFVKSSVKSSIYTSSHWSTYLLIHTSIYLFIYLSIDQSICSPICLSEHTDTHTHTHIYIYIYIYIYTLIHTLVRDYVSQHAVDLILFVFTIRDFMCQCLMPHYRLWLQMWDNLFISQICLLSHNNKQNAVHVNYSNVTTLCWQMFINRGRLRGLAVACWIIDHHHPCSNLGLGISEGCFIFDF